MKIFYRYIRRTKFNEQRMELETLPHGGICLRFEQQEDGTLFFSHARCYNDELFSKQVAKRIADHRAKNYQAAGYVKAGYLGNLEYTEETTLLAEQVIDWCMEFVPPVKAVHGQYLKNELSALGFALEQLVLENTENKLRSEVWIAGMKSTNLSKKYKDLSK